MLTLSRFALANHLIVSIGNWCLGVKTKGRRLPDELWEFAPGFGQVSELGTRDGGPFDCAVLRYDLQKDRTAALTRAEGAASVRARLLTTAIGVFLWRGFCRTAMVGCTIRHCHHWASFPDFFRHVPVLTRLQGRPGHENGE
jgi:hypothetical protein